MSRPTLTRPFDVNRALFVSMSEKLSVGQGSRGQQVGSGSDLCQGSDLLVRIRVFTLVTQRQKIGARVKNL